MRKTKHLVFGIGVLISSVVFPIFSRPAPAADESITLETYYPAPYGIYNELTTTGKTLLATEGGSVGIGTMNPMPTQKLFIKGGNVFLETQELNTDRRGLIVDNTSGLYGAVMSGGEHATGLAFYTAWDGGASNARMVVSNTGNVGIGTPTPGAKLEVSGGVKIGDDPDCNSAKAGTMRYNSGAIQYCDSGSWKGMSIVTGGLYGYCTARSDCDGSIPVCQEYALLAPAICTSGVCGCPAGYTVVSFELDACGAGAYACYKN